MSNRNIALKAKNTPSNRPQKRVATFGDVRGPSPQRWVCSHRVGTSEIEAFVPLLSSLEIIATTHDLEGVDARANAELIVRAVNEFEKCQILIVAAVKMLERCLDAALLPIEVRQDAFTVCQNAKRIIGVDLRQ